jgi:general secretion pathway protein G
MSKARRRRGFTLIEVLIVVVIMAVLAATIIPQFTSSTKDARDSSLKFNAQTVRTQIELYRAHHLGQLPTLAQLVDVLTKPTDVNGNLTGTNLPYGPYLDKIPANPYNGLNTVVAVTTAGTEPTAASGTASGWQYDATTGGFFPNNSEYFATSGSSSK